MNSYLFVFSTISQAVEVSEKMKAKHTILTHFSQRYGKVPLITENFNNKIGCAFDNMRVSINVIHYCLNTVLLQLFQLTNIVPPW